MSNEIKRMNYYNGLLLKQEDMTLDQSYHTRLHRMHNGYFHNWGIVVGLGLQKIEGTPQIIVGQGLALNRIKGEDGNAMVGQEIYIVDNHPDNPLDLSQYSPNDEIYITVSYKEVKSDLDTLKGDEEIHIWERAKINHSNKKPVDPEKDIILGRVKLKLNEAGNKIVDYISDEDVPDEEGVKLKLRKDAVPLGGDVRTSKLSVGPKEEEDMSLPYICGLMDEKTEKVSGLDIRSPQTRFTGSLQSGSINAKGNVDVEGGFSVTQNGKPAVKVNPSGKVDISGDMEIAGSLTAFQGITVKGKDTTIDTSNVAVTGNMITINRYTPKNGETAPRDQNSGLEVYRGNSAASATLVWDESDKKWKASVVEKIKKTVDGKEIETEEIKMFNIAYGVSWDNMINGSNVDNLHKHGQIWSGGTVPALSADKEGNINVSNSLNVAGSIVPLEGLKAPTNGSDPVGKIMWNETEKCWQAGTEGNMTNIPYGDDWDNLTKGENADILHTHSQFYNHDKSKVAMKINDAGDIDIPGELTVTEKLTVVGDLNVLGTTTTVNEVKLEVSDHVIVVNKHDEDTPVISEAGLEVYRGKEPRARLVWDESVNKWRMGVGGALQDIPSGDEWVELTDGLIVEDLHKHGKLCAPSGDDAVTVNEQGDTDIIGNARVQGLLAADSGADIKGSLEVGGSVNIKGNLKVEGVTTTVKTENLEVNNNVIVVNRYKEQEEPLKNQGGIEVFRGGNVENAKLIWDEASTKWKIGIGNELYELPYGDKWDKLTGKVISDSLHAHGQLCDDNGNTALSVDDAGDVVMEGDTRVKGSLDVDGMVNIDGNLVVKGSFVYGSTVKKDELEVKDNLIILNKYEGTASPVNESGIEVYRGETTEKARIVWDEKFKKWKIGIGNELYDIAYGKELTDNLNADSLHMHSQMYNANGDILAITASAAGNTDVLHNLNVGSNLTVNGNVDVRGKSTTINSEKLDVRGSVITVNKYDQQDVGLNTEGGLEVYRGGKDPNAQILWDEENDQWKLGVSGKPVLTVKSDGNIEASGTINTDSINIKQNGLLVVKGGLEIPIDAGTKAQIYWDSEYKNWKLGTNLGTGISISKEGNVGVGISPDSKFRLNVSGDANFSGKTTVNEITINKGLTLGGNLVLEGGFVESKGLQTKYKDLNDNDAYAKIYWGEKDSKWFMEGGGKVSEIPTLDHAHNKLYGENGKNKVVNVVGENDFVGISNAAPQAKLDVNGDVKISGSLDVKKGLEISLEGNSKAKLFCTNEGKWQIGVNDKISEIITGAHTHNSLCTNRGDISVKVGDDGSVLVGEKGTTRAKLEIAGEVTAAKAVIDNASIKNAEVSGILTTGGIIEVNRATGVKPLIKWDESEGKWKAGLPGDGLKPLSYEGHTHGNISGSDGSVAINVDDDGNVGINKNLTVNGNLTVDGEIVSINTKNLDVKDNIILINKYAPQPLPLDKDSGLEVYRGGTAKSARLIWNEKTDKWQAGVGEPLSDISLDGHTHKINSLYTSDGVKESVSVDNDGNVTMASKLDVQGETSVNDLRVTGSLNVNEVTVETGMAVVLADNKKAFMGWNAGNKKWEAGDGESVKEISLYGHTHKINAIHTADGAKQVLSVDNSGNVGIGKVPDANTGYMLDIAGQVRAVKITQSSSLDSYSENSPLLKEKALELFNSLTPVLFKLKGDGSGKENIGFVAENVNSILKTSDGKSISLMDIVGVLTSLVKEQQNTISDLKTDVEELKTKVAALKTDVEALQNPPDTNP